LVKLEFVLCLRFPSGPCIGCLQRCWWCGFFLISCGIRSSCAAVLGSFGDGGSHCVFRGVGFPPAANPLLATLFQRSSAPSPSRRSSCSCRRLAAAEGARGRHAGSSGSLPRVARGCCRGGCPPPEPAPPCRELDLPHLVKKPPP
jgi:hypothetical protein